MEMITREEVFVRCGSIVLEGVFEAPANAADPSPGAVVCHPHPLYGGNMHNNVTRAARRALIERGVACLRFNFRGTGRSEGSHGDGVAELEDVRAAIDFLVDRKEIDPARLLVAGYSFGCWVGLRAAAGDSRPSRLIGISPPVDSYDFGFLLNETRPKLLVAGDRDFVCSVAGFQELARAVPEPKLTVLLQGADHFHVGREDDLVREIHLFLNTYPFDSP